MPQPGRRRLDEIVRGALIKQQRHVDAEFGIEGFFGLRV